MLTLTMRQPTTTPTPQPTNKTNSPISQPRAVTDKLVSECLTARPTTTHKQPPPHNTMKATCMPHIFYASQTQETKQKQANPQTGPPCVPCKKILRKEVIQPHLPVRLPCYDFVPIASPTFDRSPQKWLGHELRVLPTFVT